ncbi:TIGR00730 family Rossman fold protein [Rhizobium leguminosarum]|uniref:LOG family protein n=1 Tax=Rhizobium leguminosarum TaxID=384 RepID=UPI001C90058A|nr:TIGR00730 family Rossman fold protein [Rhizobium leguminosarum]MBY2925891.1 TIGR00730 family Rossman fold protein [Rhizobium leguminosarum]MBY2966516.1 TIGR00730 family Rossman fold protein [Rhizobium leguminosarum]
MTIRSIKSVAVFCGSNFGASEAFADGARALGGALGEAGITIIYGGTVKGLMGVVADAALEAGGSVHGVITESLHQRGQSHAGLTRREIVETLRSRKERMVELSDAFIALPGGIGTIEELMEVWTMNQLSEIDKPVGLLNSAGFFDAFLGFIDHMVETRFLPAAHRHSISVDTDASALIDKLRSYTRVEVPKWL